LLPTASADALQGDATVVGLLIVGGVGHGRLSGTGHRLRRRRLAVARSGNRALPARPTLVRGARSERGAALLLGLVAGERNCTLVLGQIEIALDLLLHEQRQLAIAGGSEQRAVRLAQQPLLAADIGSVGRVVATLVGELRLNVDELDAVEVGPCAD